MSHFRRWYVKGGTYFFTVVTYRRMKLFAEERARALLGDCMRGVQQALPFETIAIVLLPDHLHMIMALPPGDQDYLQRIKRDFTVQWLANGGRENETTQSQAARRQRGVWQPRFWEHSIADEGDLERHADYIHYNPVKHRYVSAPLEWKHSSFERFVRAGHYEPGWGRSVPAGVAGMDLE